MSVSIRDKTTGEWVQVAGGKYVLYAESPIGSIIPFGGTTAPSGFLLCRGQAVSRTTYAELFKVIGTAFGSGDGSTTFNVPDLREATPKGVGLSGKSSNHFDSDGVALGEFVEDRVQNHTHDIICEFGANANPSFSPGGPYNQVAGVAAATRIPVAATNTNTGRHGATTEVKAIGVNYIIKATQVGAPADFAPVDVVENGNMRAVTSNAVAEALAAVNMDSAMSIDTTKWSPAGQVHATKVGQLGIILWGGHALIDISTDVNNTTKVAQLPVEFRPGIHTVGALMTIGGTVADISINPAGEVRLCCPSGTLKTYNWAWGQVVFAIGN